MGGLLEAPLTLRLLTLWAGLLIQTTAAIPVTLYASYNQAQNVLISGGDSKGGTVQFLGRFNTTQGCQEACISHPQRCWSFVHYPENLGADDLAQQCFAVLSPGFNPAYDQHTISGTVAWPCRSEEDCSLNGRCVESKCECRPAWLGDRCERLHVLPPIHGAGPEAGSTVLSGSSRVPRN